MVDVDGRVLAAAGEPATEIYPRSALKPFQAVASLDLIGHPPPTDELALMAASHTGSRAHQAVVRRLLDRAGLTPAALRCPHALPADAAALRERPEPTRLAHNCSGKHAGFLLATQQAGDPARGYLSTEAPVQDAVRHRLRDLCGQPPSGPGVDGCGAPAWRMALVATARGYARLAGAAAAPTDAAAAPPGGAAPLRAAAAPPGAAAAPPDGGGLRSVVTAMRTHPELVGGHGTVDTELMQADRRVLAKRGAEAVLGLAVQAARGPVGVAIKVADGGARALGPVAAAVLSRLGCATPPALALPVVLGGGEPHGELRTSAQLADALVPLTR